MANEYFDEIKILLKQARPKLINQYQLEFKNVFGAVGGYVNGHIFISYGKFGVALRLPAKILDDLFQEKDVKHLKYFPDGHVKKEYAIIPTRLLGDKDKFKKLLDTSIKYAASLKGK